MKINKKKLFVTIGSAILVFAIIFSVYNYFYVSAFSRNVDVQEDVDLEEYMGTWYDVYSIPVRFQDGLVNVTATYTLKDNGKVIVYNKGYKDGELKDITGTARVIDDGRLKVSFFPLIWSDYNILFTDYEFAVVGGGNPDYFWVLSRTPDINDEKLEELKMLGKEQGYKVTI